MDFDGTDDYAEVPYSASLNPAIFTLEVWVKLEGGSGTFRSVITSRQTSNTAGYTIYAGDDDQWQFWTGDNGAGTWNVQNSGVAVTADWTHIACTYDGTTKEIYINGVSGSFSYSSVIEVSFTPEISLYPNPVVNTVSLILPGGQWKGDILTAQGKLVKRFEKVGSMIDLEELPSGMYVLRLNSQHGAQIQKIFLKK